MQFKKSYSNFTNRLSLAGVYDHTIAYCQKANFPKSISVKYNFSSPNFTDESILSKAKPFENPCKIIVENIDSFDLAMKIYQPDSKPLVLNMASDYKPGGGVARGAKSQEEDLFRKSDYALVTDKSFYPLKYNEVVYSPSVYIVKDSSYNLLQSPVEVSCLAVAGIRNPKTVNVNGIDRYAIQADADLMQNKIDMIFKVAIKHSHYDLVLGALGCGVFNNPTGEVALMFKNSINQYGKYFRTVSFAIMCRSNNPNCEIFDKMLKN